MITQVRPSEMVDILGVDLQKRRESQFAWKSVISQFLALPVLRGFWPMSAVSHTAADQARDISGNGNHLTNNNVSTFGYESTSLIPQVSFNGTTQYLSRADAGGGDWADIIGTETYVGAAKRGLTSGGLVLYRYPCAGPDSSLF